MPKTKLSIVIPAYNESEAVKPFYEDLSAALPNAYDYEIIFVNDGSTDDTLIRLKKLHDLDSRIKIVAFSRNFGKESATTAGISRATGAALIIIDADGQHPVEAIAEFIEKWKAGAQTVIGIRQANNGEGFIKKYGSLIFYKLFNSLTHQKLIPGTTDFRLINRDVQHSFIELSEQNRMTRALLDWVGFRREFVYFEAKKRMHGEATYSTKKLLGLAINSFISLSLIPLHLSVYAGLAITPLAFLLGAFILIEQYILGDPMSLNFTGTASLGILTVFLVGIILLSQGVMALYISRIYEEAKGRPLFVVDESSSIL